MWSQRLRLGPKRAAKAIRSHPEASKLIPDEYLKRLESLMEQPFACLLKMLSPKEPLAIVAHCDYLRNNIAFKYSKDAVGWPNNSMHCVLKIYICFKSPAQ